MKHLIGLIRQNRFAIFLTIAILGVFYCGIFTTNEEGEILDDCIKKFNEENCEFNSMDSKCVELYKCVISEPITEVSG